MSNSAANKRFVYTQGRYIMVEDIENNDDAIEEVKLEVESDNEVQEEKVVVDNFVSHEGKFVFKQEEGPVAATGEAKAEVEETEQEPENEVQQAKKQFIYSEGRYINMSPQEIERQEKQKLVS